MDEKDTVTDEPVTDAAEETPVEESAEVPVVLPGDELAELKTFLVERGMRIMTGVLLGLLIVGGYSFYRNSQQSKLSMSSQLLSNARSIQDLEAVMTSYGETPAAPIAMMKIAKIHYNNENIDGALNQYNDFQQRFPEHQLSLAAEMGKLNCIEAKGQLEEALAGYIKYAADNPDYFLISQAILGRARCLSGLERKDEARQVYEEFIAANQDNPWTSLFEEKLERLDDK